MDKEWTLISERFLGDWVVRQTKIGQVAYPLIERTYFRPSNGKFHDLITKIEMGDAISFPQSLLNNKLKNIGSMFQVMRIAAEVHTSLMEVMPHPELMKPISWAKLAEDFEKNKK